MRLLWLTDIHLPAAAFVAPVGGRGGKFTVLSGYAHKQLLPNLKSRVQGTHYYRPGYELREE